MVRELIQRESEWPVEGLEEASSCPVCRGSERHILYDQLEDRIFGVAPGKWSLWQCESCDCAWIDPRPTRETIGIAYSKYYTHDPSDHPIVRRRGLLRIFLHDSLNGYLNARYGLGVQPSIAIGRWLVWLLPSLRAAADARCRHLMRPPDGGGRLLDFGFGSAGFLTLASQMGWNAEGVDFDPLAVDSARSRGLSVRCIDATSFQVDSELYDVITVSHVIEHVHDPVALLHELFKGLRPGGVLWVDTPDVWSPGHRRFGRHWRGLEVPRHLVLFNSPALIAVLESCGFVDIRRRWRGLSVFDVFPVSEALERGSDITAASRQGRPPMREIFAELREMLFRERREFITLTASKPVQE